MRDNDPAVSAHLQSRQGVIPRSFVWITAKNRSTGAPESLGFWNGDDTVDVTVVSGVTGLPVTRIYHGWGELLAIDAIPLVSDLTIRTIQIALSPISEAVRLAFRQYDARLAPVEIHRGFLNLDTRNLIANPRPRFIGWVNASPIETPAAGGEGKLSASIVSHTRALTKINPAKRSDETQKLRNNDRFRRYADVAGQWTFFWGEHNKVDGGNKKGLGN